MKTENTCVNCLVLECHVRRDCEDNELPFESQELETEEEDIKVSVQVLVPEPAEKVVNQKRF